MLPALLEKGSRTTGSDTFSQTSLGFFGSAGEAAAAVAAAVDAAKAAQPDEDADRFMRRDPISALLLPAGGEGKIDMNAVFKEADREDREDGRRERLELITSARSDQVLPLSATTDRCGQLQ